MKKNIIGRFMLLCLLSGLYSCVKQDDVNVLNTGNYTDTATALKDATDVTIGVAMDVNPIVNNTTAAQIARRDFDAITIENAMKHSSVVGGTGNLNFTNLDAQVNAAAAAGLKIFGHTLAWHSQQNAGYLNTYAGITQAASVELVANGGFESGSATGFNNWATYNTQNGATVTVGTLPAEIRTGSRSMRVINPVANPGNQWRVQVASDLVNTTVGTQYAVTYWAKALAPGGSIRLSTGPTAQYQGDQTIGTNWSQISWTITARDAQTRIFFDLGQAANTYYIDDVSVKQVVQAPSNTQVAAKLDEHLRTYITTMVNRYKDRVKEWDVVNELFTDAGVIRNNNNTPAGSDVLVWSNYLGRDFGLKAFQYAAQADPGATFYINDYNLESSNAKLDSLIAYVNEIKGKGAKVDGIGTQMHINWNQNYAGIDRMFQKLAATGLKVRISELDVRMNPSLKTGFTPSSTTLGYQADMYNYVVKSYLRHVPKAQQGGITIWGIHDASSWLYQSGRDFPLLYNNNFAKKPAYAGVLQALKGQ